MLEAARIGPDEIAAELGGLGAEPSPRRRPRRRRAPPRALGPRAAPGCSSPPPPGDGERVLVALSGGVDSAVAALLEREARARGRRGHAQALGRPAHRRRAQLLLARGGARRPRGSPTRSGIPHLTLDLEDEFRAGVVGPFLRGYAAGRTPNPCVRCNGELRIDAMIALADRLGAAQARHRPLRADRRRRRRARCSPRPPTPPRTRPTCSPALRPELARRACASRSAS